MEYVYRAPILTVDGVIFELIKGQLHVLLIQRANDPFKGQWALPGGYNAEGDTTRQALTRVLTAKAGIRPDDLPVIEQLYAFDTVARDPRGHAVSVVYLGLAENIQPKVSPTTHNPRFFPVGDLPSLAYDHDHIIQYALERLRARVATTTMICALLPKRFTLSQVQAAYEAVLGRALDKRNFRKKLMSFGIISPTGTFRRDGAHRPAMLYEAKGILTKPLLRNLDD